MVPFEFRPLTRVFFGTGVVERVGLLPRGNSARSARCSSPMAASCRPVTRRPRSGSSRPPGLTCTSFSGSVPIRTAPQSRPAGRSPTPLGIDTIIAVGGGSSLDCAKGINFVLTNGGGDLADYRGYGKAQTPLLPMIGVPTTAGTGSEAQSYAVIADADTHLKMACGDPTAAFRVALLDPSLTL